MSETDELLPKDRPNNSKMAITPSVELENSANDVYVALIEEDSFDHHDDNEDVRWLREQRTLNKSLHWLKRPSVIMIASILFLLAFASSSAESTRQIITLKLACNYLGEEKCTKESAQVVMSNLQLGYTISSAVITLIASGKVAPLSDQFGRKIFVVLMIMCFFLGRTCKFLLMYNFNSLKFGLMVACEIITNLCGGILALITLANCYISDVVEPHQRIYSLGISIASLFLGLSIGPLVGNFIISISSKVTPTNLVVMISKSDFLPLKFEISILFLVLLLALFILPESRSEKARRKSRTMSVSSSSSSVHLDQQTIHWSSKFLDNINFLKPLKLLLIPTEIVPLQNRHRIKKDRIAVLLLVFIDCILASLAISFAEIYVLYGIYRYNWVQTDIGHLLAIGCSSRAIVLIFLSPIINHRIFQYGFGFTVFKKQFDMVDFSMTLLGLVFEVIGFIGYSLSPTTVIFFAFTVFCGFGSLISPALNSSIVKFYPESKIGELFGAMALLKNLFGLVMPVCYLSIYKYSMRIQTPGLVFMIAAIALGVCTILLLVVKRVLGLDSHVKATVLKRSDSEVGSVFEVQTPPKTPELNRKKSLVQMERTGSFH